MSAATISLAFNDFARLAAEDRGMDLGAEGPAGALRLALLYGEQLRVPSSSEWLRVLSGTAWVTAKGEDHVLASGDEIALPRDSNGTVVSAVGHEALFFEVG